MTQNLFEEGRLFFEEYTSSMMKHKDVNIADVLMLKKEHSLRVAQLAKQIATELQLDEATRDLIELIGLIHDLGRFPQFDKYRSFDDVKTEDHAQMGIAIIKEQSFFARMGEEMQKIVLDVVGSHNRLKIELKDNQSILLCRILRDADKLDIWEISITHLKRNGSVALSALSWDLPSAPSVSPAVIKAVKAGKPIMKVDLHSINDYKLYLMTMVFDLNFKPSFNILNTRQLIRNIYETLPKRDDVIDIYRQIRLYIENKFVEQ